MSEPFRLKQFSVSQGRCAMRITSDSILLGAWVDVESTPQPRTIIDAGTGSGIIALMMAQRVPQAAVIGIEIDHQSAQQAHDNCHDSPYAERMQIVEGDLMGYAPAEPMQLLISNPPYFDEGPSCQDLRRHRARSTCGGGMTPVDLLKYGKQHLQRGGRVAMITPAESLPSLRIQAAAHHSYLNRYCLVSSSEGQAPIRVLTEWSYAVAPAEPATEQHIAIRTQDGNYTADFRTLTQAFYL